jgi:hypothetical protein
MLTTANAAPAAPATRSPQLLGSCDVGARRRIRFVFMIKRTRPRPLCCIKTHNTQHEHVRTHKQADANPERRERERAPF